MLRNRSRSVTSSKQSLMADNNSITCPRPNQTTPISSLFGSPRFFNGFFMNGVTKFESLISPTSIFSTTKIPNFVIPFGYYGDQNHPKISKNFKENNQRIGLALIVALVHDEKHTQNFGFTQKKIQIPTVSPSAISPTLSPKSPTDFGSKTRTSQFLRNSSNGDSSETSQFLRNSSNGDSSEIFTRSLSLREMELSEEYTCVISHGPNPKTTRIFDNCILQSWCGVIKEYNLTSPSKSFLSFCHTCKKNLGEGNDIYMYRGEKAFCSSECRCEEMLLDGLKNSEINNGF